MNRTNFSFTVSSFDTDFLAPTTTPSISTHGLLCGSRREGDELRTGHLAEDLAALEFMRKARTGEVRRPKSGR